MTKFRVHLEHDKSVVVEADKYEVVFGCLTFYSDAIVALPDSSDPTEKVFRTWTVKVCCFGPQRWVWVEKESEESSWDSEQSECNKR